MGRSIPIAPMLSKPIKGLEVAPPVLDDPDPLLPAMLFIIRLAIIGFILLDPRLAARAANRPGIDEGDEEEPGAAAADGRESKAADDPPNMEARGLLASIPVPIPAPKAGPKLAASGLDWPCCMLMMISGFSVMVPYMVLC